ncbi:MAG: LytR/AlgR family response regulator transcription factor [Candidatus Competibacterales bacterium]
MAITVLIVDDEEPARQRLAALVAEIEGFEVCGVAHHGQQALAQVAALVPDVVLLDVRMPDMDGLEAARHLDALEQPPALIFTTAFEDYALQAFAVNAAGYLVKPVRREHLERVLYNATRLNRSQLPSALGMATPTREEAPPRRQHLTVRLGQRVERIAVADIYYFQARHKYICARHPTGEALLEESLKCLEEEFQGSFCRIHRNALAATAHIRMIKKTAEGRYWLYFHGIDDHLEISRRQVATVRRAMGW